jgi:hypothetical protein
MGDINTIPHLNYKCDMKKERRCEDDANLEEIHSWV